MKMKVKTVYHPRIPRVIYSEHNINIYTNNTKERQQITDELKLSLLLEQIHDNL